MHLGVSELPLSHNSALSLSGPGVRCQITPDGCAGQAPSSRNFPDHTSICCSQGERVEAVQDPCAMLHWVVASQGLEPGEAYIPAWDPASESWLPTVQGLSPSWTQCLPLLPVWEKSKSIRSQKAKQPRGQEPRE